ncbi:hypothetical protein [Streptomyces sp. NBC_00623]
MKFVMRTASALSVIAAVLALGAAAVNAHEVDTLSVASADISSLSLNWD